ncbi:redoxin domain-containing protein [Candidatus Parabeggiatoa sp. HSG14]|uniref:redoxin domain-containing protein n=1 Tax=Candidatus Parabeggiatoa sp. HSG14 TaxID=3055593 RepID=UPI0025A78816|nr:redoxin domain-containing protein [Thiotrichales bacterium HSG14]
MRKLLYLIIFLMVWTPIVEAVRVDFLAPSFTLLDTRGAPISLSDFRGKHIVLEWFNPDCRIVQRHYQDKTMHWLASNYISQEVIWLAINSTYYMTQEDNIRWKDTKGLHYHLLGDFTGEVAKLYQAKRTPQMYVIDPRGILIYKGAIDDNSSENKQWILNYVQSALDESLADMPISHPKTEPYGCLVKYNEELKIKN